MGLFNQPSDIAGKDGSNFFYVCDYGNDRIVKLEFSGSDYKFYDVLHIGEGQLNKPEKMNIDDNRLYISDAYNDRIATYNTDGTRAKFFGSYGTGINHFRHPTGIAKKGEYIYVYDSGNSRIVKLRELPNDSLEWVKSVPFEYEALNRGVPIVSVISDLEIDSHGFIYLIDSRGCFILKYTPEIQFVKDYGGYGTGGGKFLYPQGLWMDDNTSKVLITERGGMRIQASLHGGLLLRFMMLMFLLLLFILFLILHIVRLDSR